MELRAFIETGGHQLSIAGSLALLAGAACAGFLHHDPACDASLTRLTSARAVLQGNPAPELPREDWSAVTAAWSPSSVAAPAGARSFVAGPKARVVPSCVRGTGAPPLVALVLSDPSAPETSAGPGRIELRWTMPPPVSGEAPVSETRIFRRSPAEPAFVLVATVKQGTASWTDASVLPRQSCTYRLQFCTLDARATHAESAFSPEATATCPAGVEIRFTGGSESAAIIVVRKWMEGDWAEESFVVHPMDEESGQKGSIGEVVWRGGKKSDFSTGMVLRRAFRSTRHFLVPVVERRLVGGVLQAVTVKRPVSRECLRIEFQDADALRGQWMEQAAPAGGEPASDDDK